MIRGKRSALFVLTGDPRRSARPAEVIRIAAGVGAWQRVEISLYLRGPAVHCLTEYAEELIDGDHFVRYLPLIGEWERPVYVQRGAPALRDLGEAVLDYREVDDNHLAALIGRQDWVLRF